MECGFGYQRAEAIYRSKADEQTIADFEAELEKKWLTSCKTIPMGQFLHWMK